MRKPVLVKLDVDLVQDPMSARPDGNRIHLRVPTRAERRRELAENIVLMIIGLALWPIFLAPVYPLARWLWLWFRGG